MKEEALIITYETARDASCQGDEITAENFHALLESQEKFVKSLEEQGFNVIKIPFDVVSYRAYLSEKNLEDTRASRATWAGGIEL